MNLKKTGMHNIVIIDDEEQIVRSIKRYCEEFKKDGLVDKIKTEVNSEKFFDELLDTSIYQDFNTYLLDIDMPIKGDELAKKIKNKYPYSQIVFISDYDNRMEHTFKSKDLIVNVLDKPIKKEKLKECLLNLCSRNLSLSMTNIKSDEKISSYVSTKDLIAITSDLNNIIDLKNDLRDLCMSKNNIALLFKNNDIFKIHSSLSEFINGNKISINEFIKLSGSTYLNKKYITKFIPSNMEVYCKNDKFNYKFPVSRDNKSEVKKFLDSKK